MLFVHMYTVCVGIHTYVYFTVYVNIHSQVLSLSEKAGQIVFKTK